MVFNSWAFAIFLPVVFSVYWFFLSKREDLRPLFLLIVSYVFYGWWDYRFLTLIFLSSAIDFFLGLKLGQQRKKVYLWISLISNLGMLGFFKYYNFFIENFAILIQNFGIKTSISTLNVILPVGISFYTFQTLSYTIDVYRGKIKPERDPVKFFAFVSFFPQLVAGPIERAADLLPQFHEKKRFDDGLASDGLRQMLWGIFKKVVIADNCGTVVDQVFSHPSGYSGSALALGSFLFAFQIYCDFSGYSDIAIGVAKLFGFRLRNNFSYPYFSRDIAAFWRRWHISLTSWFKDYLYIPLGGSKGKSLQKIRNVFAIFLVSGFWHGANWTFVFWGALNAVFFLPLLFTQRNRRFLENPGNSSVIPKFREVLDMTSTFFLVTLGWIFFRANSMQDAIFILKKIMGPSLLASPGFRSNVMIIFPMIAFMLLVEWGARHYPHGLYLEGYKTWQRRIMYIVVIALIFVFGVMKRGAFIYFQF